MAQVKLLKVGSDGVSTEMDTTADDITLLSYTVDAGGPVLDGAGLDLNDTDVVDVKDLDFNDPSTGTIDQTSGPLIVDDLMFQTKENSLTVGSAVLFPVVTDAGDEVDAFRLPTLAGTPTAAPADGGEGYLVWDSTNDSLFAWTGSVWDDLSTVNEAQKTVNNYTSGEILALNDFLYISAADTVSKADVSGAGTPSRGMGFAKSAVGNAVTVGVCSEGVLTGFAGLTATDRMYADPATPGLITATIPVGTGNTIVQVGYAKSATELHIHIEQLGRRT